MTTRIKELRLQQGMSQEKLAQISGVSMRTVQNVERGGNAKVSTIMAFASALGVKPAELLPTEAA